MERPPLSSYELLMILSENEAFNGSTSDVESRATIGRIFDDALESPFTTFSSIFEQERRYSYSDSITLIADPCTGAGQDGERGCNAVCGDPEQLFGSWQTLWSCLTLASLSLAPLTFDGLDEKMGFGLEESLSGLPLLGNITLFDGKAVLNKTYECALASCQFGSFGNCSTEWQKNGQDFLNGTTTNWAFLNESYCDNIEGTVNVDIAGPGVAISYLLQSILALFSWLAIQVFTAERPLNAVTTLLARLCRRSKISLASFFPRFASILHRMAESNFTHATSSLLADFHEAQCFFILVISIAVIYANRQGASFNGADNWQSILLNGSLTIQLVQTGVFPLILTQLTLYWQSMDSVYSLGCSTLALIMAGVSLTQLHMPGADRVHEMFKDEPGLDECGGKPSLRTFCNDGRVGYEPSAAIFLWLIVLMALWCVKIYFLVAERRASPFAMKKANRASDASAAASIWTRPSQFFMSMCGKLLDLAMWGMQLTLAVYVGSSIDMFGHDPLVQQSNVATGGMGVWNVGQVTAMLIWLPMIAKYLYTLLFGVERGFAIRLSNAFLVMRRPRTAENNSGEEMASLRGVRREETNAGEYASLDEESRVDDIYVQRRETA